jgi:hypothetical protein
MVGDTDMPGERSQPSRGREYWTECIFVQFQKSWSEQKMEPGVPDSFEYMRLSLT